MHLKDSPNLPESQDALQSFKVVCCLGSSVVFHLKTDFFLKGSKQI